MRIILIRHAQTIKNKEGMILSRGDSDLTNEGKDQINKIVNQLSGEKIADVYCSSLGRALITADEISKTHNLITKVDDRLMELNWGDFSNLPTKEVINKWSTYYESEKRKGVSRELIRPPNGENSFDHAKRVKEFIDDLKKNYENETIAIVGHSGTNKVFIGILKKIDPEQFYEVKQDNGCINYLELDENMDLVKFEINITAHLNN